ncbi:MAG: hypothetical protein F9K16_14785 [Thermoanaerobaculia bacterium]|nr:MAG: hypothetical protein F9K16_14785 [Thermoanaerobaculia bacterium]
MKKAILTIVLGLLVVPAFAQGNGVNQPAAPRADGLVYLPPGPDAGDLERRLMNGQLTEDEMAKLGLDPEATKGIGSPTDHLLFTPRSTPCDLYDSRLSTRMVAGETRSFDVRGVCSVPNDAAAISMTIVAVDAAAKGNFQVWAYNGSAGAAVINFGPGAAYGLYNLINGVNMRLCTSGCTYDLNVKLNFASSSHVLVSVNGWYTPLSGVTTVGGASFIPDGNVDIGDWFFSFSGGYLRDTNVSDCFVAPVALPHGSSVGGFCGSLYDNTASDSTFDLRQRPNFADTGSTILYSVATTGAATTYQNPCDYSSPIFTVDNVNYTYFITTCMAPDHRIYSFRIYYN